MSTSLARITPEAEREIGESIAVCAAHVPAVTTAAGFDTATADLTDVKGRQKRLEELRSGLAAFEDSQPASPIGLKRRSTR